MEKAAELLQKNGGGEIKLPAEDAIPILFCDLVVHDIAGHANMLQGFGKFRKTAEFLYKQIAEIQKHRDGALREATSKIVVATLADLPKQ